MRLLLTADWHLDKSNRLDDFEKSITFMVDYAIQHSIRKFFILGDLYRDWHSSPVEKDIVHKILLRLAKAKVDVYIILGNHDVDDKNLLNGMTATQELATLKVPGVRIISEPEIIAVGDHTIVALPHLSKRFLEAERKKTGAEVTYLSVLRKYMSNSPSLALGHMLIADALKGASDMGADSPRSVRLHELTTGFNIPMFFGDIHLPQRMSTSPIVEYVGSPDRINFGEASDEKRFIVYDIATKGYESIAIPNRLFFDIKVNLDTNIIRLAGATSGELPMDDRPPMDNLRALLAAIAPTLKDSVVKFSVEGHKDKIDQLIKHELAASLKDTKPYLIKSVTFLVTDDTTVRDNTYSKIPTDLEAFTYWVSSKPYSEEMKTKVMAAGTDLLKSK